MTALYSPSSRLREAVACSLHVLHPEISCKNVQNVQRGGCPTMQNFADSAAFWARGVPIPVPHSRPRGCSAAL